MKFRSFFIIFFFSIPIYSFSQVVKGIVIDSETTVPIPYAEIYTEKFGCITGEKGQYHFDSNLIKDSDSIYFRCLGYETSILSIRDFISSNSYNIKLERKEYEINEAKVYAEEIRTKAVKKGFYKKEAHGIFGTSGVSGYEVAVYIDNSKEKNGKIKKLYYFIHKQGRPTDKFRIHLYSAIDKDTEPQEELLPESILVNAEKGNSWVEVDIEKFNIDYPQNGFFVALEFLKDTFAVAEYNKSGFWKGGDKLNLGMNSEKENQGYTWTYNFDERKWTQKLPSRKDIIIGNAMIAADIKIYK